MRLALRSTCIALLLGAIGLPAGAGAAIDIPALPPHPVVDLAGIVEQPTETRLNNYLRELEEKTGAQVAVLTVTSLEGRSIEEFALEVAHDRWRLGQKGKDNGLLLVVAVDDRKYRFEVGYGLEGILPDGRVGSIGRDDLVPYFRKGDYNAGIDNAILAIAAAIAQDAGVEISGLPVAPPPRRAGKEKSSEVFPVAALIVFLVILLVYWRLFTKARRHREWRGYRSGYGSGGFGGGGGGFGGSGGFGGGGFGGGFGGGGGGFGGGGASGSW